MPAHENAKRWRAIHIAPFLIVRAAAPEGAKELTQGVPVRRQPVAVAAMTEPTEGLHLP